MTLRLLHANQNAPHRVYGASILALAPQWLALRAEWTEVHFTAQWPAVCKTLGWPAGHPDKAFSPEFYRDTWLMDHDDILESDIVMLWASPTDQLRGALVEAGIALGAGLKVLLVGENKAFGTWQHHPQVSRVGDLLAARKALAAWRKHGPLVQR